LQGLLSAALNYGARHRNAAALPRNLGGCGGILTSRVLMIGKYYSKTKIKDSSFKIT
jgi:hypothetical protein